MFRIYQVHTIKKIEQLKECPVYKDSCLEAFLNFAPEDLEKGYLNFEVNANSALLNGFGPGRGIKRKN